MKNNRTIKMLLGLCCLLSSGFFAEEVSSDCQSELSQINEEIVYLEEVKTRYHALVLIHEEQAMRWQFDPHLKQEARRSLKLADSERRVIQEIQERIDHLYIRRDQLLKSS
ncbi:hypothetical protein RHABOEDO_000787 [Candidatus Rhabdochlamydia oedothoracis]|uniref:Secreted protein n=1 Tax=Candidatus Rhabdochlamydia oedothoracis TaxID=2720720 RepID=A0ABX8V056_9BACT|nr:MULTISPECIES: hypothetical protein [Rhabdochlamydia]KAG6558770.1 hypothetical protein RHOW815_001243 [Candidatus Rhabdochlamydia sp. W815]MCL6755839.1 hypothetical protein [Candidatus Rhabdochlamydia oedothoracis]QYF48599.1 hypothetical protein RHABOEDO_000787 [Candidatus Rhabdochlamydia oedothoracis]